MHITFAHHQMAVDALWNRICQWLSAICRAVLVYIKYFAPWQRFLKLSFQSKVSVHTFNCGAIANNSYFKLCSLTKNIVPSSNWYNFNNWVKLIKIVFRHIQAWLGSTQTRIRFGAKASSFAPMLQHLGPMPVSGKVFIERQDARRA